MISIAQNDRGYVWPCHGLLWEQRLLWLEIRKIRGGFLQVDNPFDWSSWVNTTGTRMASVRSLKPFIRKFRIQRLCHSFIQGAISNWIKRQLHKSKNYVCFVLSTTCPQFLGFLCQAGIGTPSIFARLLHILITSPPWTFCSIFISTKVH